ncbi:MAG TPA: hypothetical protein EYH11_03585 [Sulfurimonas autotrophica]|nr:hypothetical protein [Sulfurimonas autotrophica]
MKYSYIKPRKKTPFTPELQIVFTFFFITLIILFSTYLFLLFKEYRFEKDKKQIREHTKELKTDIENMQDQINFIQKQKALAEKIFTKNMVLKDSIANLFDLVPQRITLSRAQLLKNGLILYGITPNKDVYNFMLQAPLRSIFHKTYSSFYPAKNGWLMFVSTNYMDESQIEELASED